MVACQPHDAKIKNAEQNRSVGLKQSKSLSRRADLKDT